LLTIDELNESHKKEARELQARIQSLKKSVTKGDKKKKKDVDLEIATLEKEFEEKCLLEITNLEAKLKSNAGVQQAEEQTKLELATSITDKQAKLSKAQKRREKKEKKEQDRDGLIAMQEIENKKGPAFIELSKIKQILKSKGLQLKEVISDGNCMYYAIADQCLAKLNMIKSCQELRNAACEHMLKNPDDYRPFCASEDGELMDEEAFNEYCMKIKDPRVWGSSIELKALAEVFNVLIEVVQADGAGILIGESEMPNKEKLTLTYHRHMFGSGEHYNSTQPANTDTTSDND
jgi:OTU domain-containing protein 6